MTIDFDSFLDDRSQGHVSVGYMCGLLQILPAQLRTLMEACDVRFSLVLDGVGYVSVADAEAIAAKCRDVLAEIDSVANSHKTN